VPENIQRLIELLNLQWFLQNRDRTNLKNPIEDLAIWVTCDHDNVEVRINLLGCFIHLITGSVRQLQVQKHEIEFLLPEAFNGLFSRIDHHSTEADLLQKCSKEILQAQIVVDHQHRWLALLVLAQNVVVQRGFLDPPAAADLNGRNLSALYEIVDSRERNPQVRGRLFYGQQIVNWGFAHSLGKNPIINHRGHYSDHKNRFFPACFRPV